MCVSYLVEKPQQTLNMFDRLKILKQKGYEPEIIFDIGAYHGNWTDSMQKIYPNAAYYLFEAINYKELDRFMYDTNIKVFKNVVLNDCITEVDWYEQQNTGDSFFKENGKCYMDTAPFKRQTIDLNSFITAVCADEIYGNNKTIFVKIDCQGAEIPILKGASTILNRVDFILLEMPVFGKYNAGVPTFLEHVQYMESIGFIPYDIVENRYINQFNMQTDILFINKSHIFNKIVQDIL